MVTFSFKYFRSRKGRCSLSNRSINQHATSHVILHMVALRDNRWLHNVQLKVPILMPRPLVPCSAQSAKSHFHFHRSCGQIMICTNLSIANMNCNKLTRIFEKNIIWSSKYGLYLSKSFLRKWNNIRIYYTGDTPTYKTAVVRVFMVRNANKLWFISRILRWHGNRHQRGICRDITGYILLWHPLD